ncbi:ATP-binding protein [Nocardia noduli]|uniref:ATP-binding protein n=1 Tax=Nocardia noduli TaxID=2815722 RepID=UPI001C215321|nr:ATP-binding protein [Nocardia noduli]
MRAAGAVETRILRLYCRFIGIGYLTYLGIEAHHILADTVVVAPWWTPLAVAAIFLPGIAVGAATFGWWPVSARTTATVAALSFLLPTLTWLLAWNGRTPPITYLWIVAIPGLAGLCAAAFWPARAALGYTTVLVTLTQLLNHISGAATAHLIPDLITNISYCLLLTGAGCIAVRTGRVLDRTRSREGAQAAAEAARTAKLTERRLFLDLIHTWVMATLLAAARGTLSAGELRRHAEITLAKLARLDQLPPSTEPVPLPEVAGRIAAAVREVDAGTPIQVAVDPGVAQHPALVAEVFAAAAAEAVRNSYRHAGSGTVTLEVNADRIQVRVSDQGPGFDRGAVEAERLGLRAIEERVGQLPGGSVSITTGEGRGTTVTLQWRAPQTEADDIRTLLGMRQPVAWFAVGGFLLGMGLQAATARVGITTWWPVGVALLVLTAAAAALLIVPGDPMPVTAALAVTAAGPIAMALVCAVLPVPVSSGTQLWPLFLATTVYAFLCVRGRIGFGWAGSALIATVAITWAVQTGQGLGFGIGITAIDLAPMTMATAIALTVRPAARDIYRVRAAALRRAATAAHLEAATVERSTQLTTLNPELFALLEQIRTQGRLAEAEAATAGLFEAHLRSIARAPGLAQPLIGRAAWQARRRGIEVRLFDDGDGRAEDLDDTQRARFAAWVATELDTCATASVVTVRINPPRRPALATLVAREAKVTRRRSYEPES